MSDQNWMFQRKNCREVRILIISPVKHRMSANEVGYLINIIGQTKRDSPPGKESDTHHVRFLIPSHSPGLLEI